MRALLLVVVPLLLSGVAMAQNQTDNSTNATAPTPAGPATASVTMIAHAEGGSFYWTLEGPSQHNPTITVQPDADITVTVKNSGDQTHNFAVEPDTHGSAYVNTAGDTTTYEFTMPDHDVQYYCVPHKTSGMIGKITTGGATGGQAPPPAAEAPPAPTSFTIVGHAEGGSFYWTLEGQSQHNPTITVQPDADITVTVKNSGSTSHNFAVGSDTKGSDYVNTESDVATYTFHSGAEGQSVSYFCVPHGGSGMKGTIKFAKTLAAPSSGGGGTSGTLGTGTINGAAADLGQVSGDSKCSGMPIPEAVANGEIGGPTVNDYKKRCEEGGVSAEGEARAASGADYVIPASFVLIALGVVAVVYVHKYYKP